MLFGSSGGGSGAMTGSRGDVHPTEAGARGKASEA